MNANHPRYRIQSVDGVTVLAFDPELSEAPMTELDRLGQELLQHLQTMRSPAVLVDLSALSYMGSAMVALIVRIWKWVQERDGRMVVVNRHQMIAEILNISGLHQIWTIVETQEEGLAELGVGRGSTGTAWALLEALAVLGAFGGLALLFDPIPQVVHVPARGALLAGCAFAIVGVIAGTVGALRQRGGRRGFALFVVTASVLVILTGVLSIPPFRKLAPNPIQNVLPEENPRHGDDPGRNDGNGRDAGDDQQPPVEGAEAALRPRHALPRPPLLAERRDAIRDSFTTRLITGSRIREVEA